MGMVERMDENYSKVQELFVEELRLLINSKSAFLEAFAVYCYEQVLIMLKINCLDKAEELMMHSLHYAEQSDDQICLGCSLRVLGKVFAAKDEKQRAKNYYLMSLKAFKEANDESAINGIKSLINQL